MVGNMRNVYLYIDINTKSSLCLRPHCPSKPYVGGIFPRVAAIISRAKEKEEGGTATHGEDDERLMKRSETDKLFAQ